MVQSVLILNDTAKNGVIANVPGGRKEVTWFLDNRSDRWLLLDDGQVIDAHVLPFVYCTFVLLEDGLPKDAYISVWDIPE